MTDQTPKHTHSGEDWTQAVLAAHLRDPSDIGHGKQPPADAPLGMMSELHALDHGRPEDEIFRAALAPARRYESITLGEPRNGYPGDLALFFHFLNDNGTTLVNLRPGDMPLLRAAVIPEDPQLKDIQDAAVAALGPGARKYVQQAHSAGYGTGVRDMEAVRETMTEAEQVSDFLAGLYEEFAAGRISTIEPGLPEAIDKVRDLITRRMEDAEARRA